MAMNFPAVTDHSWARPSPQLIKGSGYLGVMRYIGPQNGPGGRDLSRPEQNSYHAVGLKVGYIVEGAASSVLGGADKGIEFGRMANDQLTRLGVPKFARIISTAVDFQATRDQLLGPIAAYHRAFNDVCDWAGDPYGNDLALDVLVGELRLSPCGWQTRAWSGGRVSRHACMMQEVGYVLANTSDHNSIYRMDDVEQLVWHPDDAPFGPPQPPATTEDDEMIKTYMLTSTRANRDWLTRKNRDGVSAGMIGGLTNSQGQPIDGNGVVIPDEWNSVWAGLATWEQQDGSPFTRAISVETTNFYKACAYAMAVGGGPVSIVDLGFVESSVLGSKTAMDATALMV